MNRLVPLIISLAIIATLIGCGLGEKPLASIELNFERFQAKNILPDESMDVVTIDVHGAGPESTSFDVSSGGENVTVDELIPGEWTMTAVGKNDVGTQIAGGSAVATLVIGAVTNVSLILDEDSGSGTLNLTLTWEPDIIDTPVPYGLLTYAADSSETNISADLAVNLLGTTTTHTGSYLDGWYSFVYKMYDDTVLSGGYATAIRMAEGISTTGSAHLYVAQATGGFQFDFTTNMREVIDLTVNNPEGTFIIYGDSVVTFSADGGEAGVYAWYVNGEFVDTAMTYDIDGAPYAEDDFLNLDVIFFTADASGGGSAHWAIDFEAAPTVGQTKINATASGSGSVRWELFTDTMGFVEEFADSLPCDFDSSVLAYGGYKLNMYDMATGDNYFYVSDGVTTTEASNATVLTIPESVDVVYDFGSFSL